MKDKSLDARLDRQLAEYKAARRNRAKVLAGTVLTAGAACACAPDTLAAIQYHDINPDVVMTYGTAGALYNVNILGVNRFEIYDSAWHANGFSIDNHANSANGVMAQGATNHYAKRFVAGSTIGAGAVWQTGWQKLCGSDASYPLRGAFLGVDGYIGIRFRPAATNLYGWIRFEGSANGHVGTVKAWAYQDDGTGIRAGEAQ